MEQHVGRLKGLVVLRRPICVERLAQPVDIVVPGGQRGGPGETDLEQRPCALQVSDPLGPGK